MRVSDFHWSTLIADLHYNGGGHWPRVDVPGCDDTILNKLLLPRLKTLILATLLFDIVCPR